MSGLLGKPPPPRRRAGCINQFQHRISEALRLLLRQVMACPRYDAMGPWTREPVCGRVCLGRRAYAIVGTIQGNAWHTDRWLLSKPLLDCRIRRIAGF